jgi:glycosyltransferase involved in cell wall biosynthesis
LRIGIDVHTIGARKTGNERFITNIVRELRGLCTHELFLYFGSQDAPGLWPKHPLTHTRAMAGPSLLRVPYLLPRISARDRLDVLLVQYTAAGRIRFPVVPVIHDVSFASEQAASYFSTTDRMRMRATIPRTMRRAPRIITVSEFSRDEIVRLYGIPRDRIDVAHDAPDPKLTAMDSKSPAEAPPYFLAIGNIERRKNLITLVRAFARLRSEHPEISEKLVIVGKDGYGAAEVKKAAAALGDPRIVFAGYIADAALASLLAHATCLAYPSAYEGFGLPVIEAMAAGVPALASDIPVMREVAGDAGMLLPVQDPSAWADALFRIATNEELRLDMISKGRARAARFSWKASAEVVLESLERAAAEPLP